MEAKPTREKPYTFEFKRYSDGTWFARVVQFPGCMTEGDTQAETFENLNDAMESWIEARLEDGLSIPEPIGDYSGKFLVRVPKSLHAT